MLNFRINGYFTVHLRNFHRITKTDRRILMMTKFGPPVDRSMRVLDRSFFRKDVRLVIAVFPDQRNIGSFVKSCKGDLLSLPSLKHIVSYENTKGVLLRDDIDDINNYEGKLSSETCNKLRQFKVTVKPYTLTLDYRFWRADDILRAILPEELLDDIPTSFSQAGHVAHINLKNEFKNFGKLIGEVILDKNSQIETVVDKVDTIDTKFRTFEMNILAGKNDLYVEQSESGCKFRFDFSKVYWNSRLSTEHDRMIKSFAPHEVICDVFAGVGPFAIPAGKKNIFVLANDLNPYSFKYLKENTVLNGVKSFVQSYNLDGRDFIRQSPKLLLGYAEKEKIVEKRKMVKRRKICELTQQRKEPHKELEIVTIPIPKCISNYVMNLPDSAITFLDAFIGLYKDFQDIENYPCFKLPTISVYCFEKYDPQEKEPCTDELHKRVHQRIANALEYEIPFNALSFHLVRKVAPTKPMFCVEFTLPKEVAFRN